MTFTPTQARSLGTEAFVYGFPLLLMTATMRRATAPAENSATGIGSNHIGHLRRFPDPAFKAIVAPNANTLYSLAWLDLSVEPLRLELPDTGGRSYLMSMTDAWTNVFASLASHTVGNDGGTFTIVGPGWSGTLPKRARRIDAPTNNVWAIYHLHAGGSADLDASCAIQQHLTLAPLRSNGAGDGSPKWTEVSALNSLPAAHRQVMEMDAQHFFVELVTQMATNPPAPDDAPLLERLAAIRLYPKEQLDWFSLSDATREGLSAGLEDGKAAIMSEAAALGAGNGWHLSPAGAGSPTVDYLQRARAANFALGISSPQDAIFPLSATDSENRPLNGVHRYALNFEAGALPPVGAHWSLCLYDMDQLFTPNAIDRYALGDRDELELGSDGSLQIVIQHDPPDCSTANWLPAPEGDFNLMLHMYWPSQQALDGDWVIPPVQRVD